MDLPRIAFLSSWDTRDRRSWSGTPYYMARALNRHCGEVVHLGPAESWLEAVASMRNRMARRLRIRERPVGHSIALARDYARTFAHKLRDHGPFDVIFAPAASTQIAMLETEVPIIYTSDATFDLINDYHPVLTGLQSRYVKIANDLERAALQRAKLVSYPSSWAAKSSVEFYGVDPGKVTVSPWGANLDRIPLRGEVVDQKSLDRCELLFLGVNWERKGGPIALQAACKLRERGIDANLTICGSTPSTPIDKPWVRVIPSLNKENPREQQVLSELLLQANFLLLPTRNDCFGIVFSEASAHGTPSVATDTGGVGGAVKNGVNGYLLPYEADGNDFADTIERLWLDKAKYLELVATSRDYYDAAANWDTWAQNVGVGIRDVIDRRQLQMG